jgi:hypothetical protein
MANRLRDYDFLPTKFSGNASQDPLAHWLSYEDYCNVHTLGDQDQINKFKLTLSDEARLWIDGKQFVNPRALKDAFVSRFSQTSTREGALVAFRTAKLNPGEGMESFVSRLRRLATRIGYDDEIYIRDQFLSGIPDDVRIATVMTNPDDLNEAVTAAQKFIDLRSQSQHVAFQASESGTDAHDLADRIASSLSVKFSRDSQRLDNRHSYNRRRSPTPHSIASVSPGNQSMRRHPERGQRSGTPSNQRRNSRSPRRSFHPRRNSRGRSPNRRLYRSDSRSSSRNRRTSYSGERSKSRDYRCYFCNKKGHFMSECKLRKEELCSLLDEKLKVTTKLDSKNENTGL